MFSQFHFMANRRSNCFFIVSMLHNWMKLKIERGIFWMRVKANEISLTNGQWKISWRNRLKPTKDRGHILDDPSGSYWRVVNSYWQKHEEYALHAYRATFCYLCWRTLYSSLVSSTLIFKRKNKILNHLYPFFFSFYM